MLGFQVYIRFDSLKHHLGFWQWFVTRDVTINREPVENRFIYVTIQIGWDAKQIVIQLGVGVYIWMYVRGELTVFRKV